MAREKVKPRKTAPVLEGDTGPKFFTDVRNRLAEPRDGNVLLNIPVWGWTGDGKTSALVTVLHFCEPPQHGMGFALVSDPAQLSALEAAAPEYRGMNLTSLAASTTTRFRAHSERFIDGTEPDWPHPTDEASTYLLQIRSVNATIGYVVFPDLRGGSFRESDDVARAVLAGAHACVILVNPTTYVSREHEGKRYRDEIAGRLHTCAELRTPVCLMITKADQYDGPNAAVDQCETELSILVEHQQGLNGRIRRVSTVEPAKLQPGDKPPPVVKREPGRLIAAWIWVVDQALQRPAAEIRATVPNVQLRNADAAPPVAMKAVAELRAAGDFSNAPGRALVAHSDAQNILGVLFIDEDGDLVEARTSLIEVARPENHAIGSAADWDDDIEDLQTQLIGGEILVGARRNIDTLWRGIKGDTLVKTSLPSTILSWTAVTNRRLVGVDTSGRLHSLRVDDTKWTQVDFVPDFLPATERAVCVFDPSGHVLASNGDVAAAVNIGQDGRFGTRSAVTHGVKFDGTFAVINKLGTVAAVMASGKLVAGTQKPFEIGAPHPDFRRSVAIAPDRRVVAMVGGDLRLTVSVVTNERARSTEPTHSPVLPALPEGLLLTPTLDFVVVVGAGGKTWSLFRYYGLTSDR